MTTEHELESPSEPQGTGRTRPSAKQLWWITWALIGVGLVGLSLLSSAAPDGLSRVANDMGFADAETEHAANGSPFAGYETLHLDGPLGQLAAGLVGLGAVLLLMNLVLRLLRRP